jgi:hypothetical protein
MRTVASAGGTGLFCVLTALAGMPSRATIACNRRDPRGDSAVLAMRAVRPFGTKPTGPRYADANIILRALNK